MDGSDYITINEISLPKDKFRNLVKTIFNKVASERNKRGNVKIPKQMEFPDISNQLENPNTTVLREPKPKSRYKQLMLPFVKKRKKYTPDLNKAPKITPPTITGLSFFKKLDMSKPPFYTDADKWFKDNFSSDNYGHEPKRVWIYIGPNIDKEKFYFGQYFTNPNLSEYNQFYDDREKNMEIWNFMLKEKLEKKYKIESRFNENFYEKNTP